MLLNQIALVTGKLMFGRLLITIGGLCAFGKSALNSRADLLLAPDRSKTRGREGERIKVSINQFAISWDIRCYMVLK